MIQRKNIVRKVVLIIEKKEKEEIKGITDLFFFF